jgi:hypothetical protein
MNFDGAKAMKNNALFAPLAALAMVASPVAASTAMARPAPSEEASVPFINHGAIRIGARTATA